MANSAFVLVIITTVMPIFFKDVASAGVSNAVSTANWGFANAISSLMLAVMAPILGTFADYPNYKKRLLLFFFCLGFSFTLLLTQIHSGAWRLCLFFFIFAKLGFSGANIFYDAFLTDVTSKERMDWISALGFGWGYIGSVIPFLGVILLVALEGSSEGITQETARSSFIIVAFWWLVFSIPLFKNVKQVHYVPPARHPVRESFKRLAGTFREIRRYRQAFIFLIAYFFYIDGVDTIIIMAVSYGRDIGFGVNMLILVVLMIQIVAFPMAVLYGRLAGIFGTRKMLYVGIWVYVGITFMAFFLPSFESPTVQSLSFWLLAFFVATSQGGLQALSRSYFGRLIPAQRSAEFFGFYNIFGKFAAITGPFLVAMISRLTGESRYGILSILLLFFIGAFMLKGVHAEKHPG
ncbi:MAG: MFS transporter [Desulfobacterales bacterium]